jgi:short-subunit dehydrogenase involved in D-alanine esterification of teichoic acids
VSLSTTVYPELSPSIFDHLLEPSSFFLATKAFIHSWTWSLRGQLSPFGVRVIGIYPPLVESDLHRSHDDPDNNKKSKNPNAMSMEEFMHDVVQGLEDGKEEIGAGTSKQLVNAYREAFDIGTQKTNGLN